MSGYLEGYGAGEATQERRRWIVIGWVLLLSLVAVILYFTFRDYKQEQKLAGFIEAVRKQDLPAAYAFWGCTRDAPCRDYPFAKFVEDWGPDGVNAKFVNGQLVDSERCGTGYIAGLKQGSEMVTLWVERETGVVGYSPWDGCPERKLRPMRWLRSRFGQKP